MQEDEAADGGAFLAHDAFTTRLVSIANGAVDEAFGVERAFKRLCVDYPNKLLGSEMMYEDVSPRNGCVFAMRYFLYSRSQLSVSPDYVDALWQAFFFGNFACTGRRRRKRAYLRHFLYLLYVVIGCHHSG